MLRAAVLFWLFASVAHAQGTIQRVRRPPPLEQQPRCELYRGTASGNSDALIELRLCPLDGGAVQGTHQWSSETSGWSQRAVEGRWEGDRFVAREVRFIENRPAEGWRFCLIDRYELTRAGDRLAGTFVSEACTDRGTFDLTRVSEAVPPPPPRAPPRAREEEPERAFGCAAAPRDSDAPPIALVAIAAVLLARRRIDDRPKR